MTINRQELVTRHNIRLTRPDPQAPLTVGNGEFAFSVDITGLQTFPEFHLQGMAQLADFFKGLEIDPAKHSMQLGCQSQWGWHTMPNPHGFTLEDAMTVYPTAKGPVGYPDRFPDLPGQVPGQNTDEEAGIWLHTNPQRLDLGQIGLEFLDKDLNRAATMVTDLTETVQTLDLWQGLIESSFQYDGEEVRVWTVCHPELDLLAVRLESALIREKRLQVRIAFPYASTQWNIAADWTKPQLHTTSHNFTGNTCTLERKLDEDRYYVRLAWHQSAILSPGEIHQYRLSAQGAETIEFVIRFSPEPIENAPPSFDETKLASANHWANFWQQGAAVDFSGSSDPRAAELERRVILSQYLTATNCAGSLPPQETGLVCNSWFGKFHLEMHWWHAAHFALWGRPYLLERSLPWYQKILPQARATAQRQGYKGVRWPKQVGPEGRESPSSVGPFLIWQQPHPIYLAELLWRARPQQATLERYRELVFETAEFMASFPQFDGERYVLGAPLIPAQESYAKDRTTVVNPTFELAYWYWGLETAQKWRERLGLERNKQWEEVKEGLARPQAIEGVYPAIATAPYTIHNDHPSMLAAFGMVPPTPLIDLATMRQTLQSVKDEWDWASSWGWDYPVLAMCAARLGDPKEAVDALLMNMPKNTYLANGHNLQIPTFLPLYLPGNGGLLAAIALMVAGWDETGDRPAPGFPTDGNWKIHSEGFLRMP